MSKEDKHILFIHHGKGIGGAPISMRNLIDEIITLPNVKIKILFLFKSDAESLFEDIDCPKITLNKPYYYFNLTSRAPKWYRFDLIFLMLVSWIYTAYIRAPRLIKKLNPDLIYLNSSVLTDWSFAAHKLGIKNILHVREAIGYGRFRIRYKVLSKLLNKYPDFIVFISKENKKRLNILDDRSSLVVYNDIGIKFDSFTPPKRIFSNSQQALKVGFLGGMSRIKGLETLVEAFPYLQSYIEVFLGGHLKEKKYTAKFGPLPKGVKIVGLVDDVVAFIQSIDLLVVPILTSHFCRPVIEAAALGKPSILPNLSGMEEMIEADKTGFIYEAGNAKMLAETINYAANNKSKLLEMGTLARKKYENDFARDININKIKAVFSSFICY